MTEAAAVLHGIPAPEDRWDDLAAGGLNVLEGLAYRSNLLGADRAVANVGGGNTSAKETTTDHTGREVRVLWVKGSGTDLATITTEGFAGLRLDELLPLRELAEMDDATMVEYLLHCGLRPGQPRPSIETLLHAFVPAPHVDHTHPDAVIALTSTPRGRELAQGGLRPRGGLARLPAPRLRHVTSHRPPPGGQPGGAGGAARASWPRHLGGDRRRELPRHARVRRPSRRGHRGGRDGRFGLGGPKVAELREGDRRSSLLASALPALRGALLADADGLVLEVDTSPAAVAFASSVRGPEVSQVGAPCPDHLISTKHKPLVVEFDPAVGRRCRAAREAPGRRRRVLRLVSTLLRAKRRRRDPSVPDRSRRTSRRARPGCRHRDDGQRRRAGEDRPRPLPPGDRRSGCRGRARWLPLVERERGIRDRVLAARALQARAGAAARRAGGTGRCDHGRRERDRARGCAGARGARCARRHRRSERRGRGGGRGGSRVRLWAATCACSAGRRNGRGGSAGAHSPRGPGVRRHRHPRLLGGPGDERADHGDDPRGMGAQLRRARPRLLPRLARGVPGDGRAGSRRLDRVRCLEECPRRRRERGGVLVGEGRVTPPRQVSRRGRRSARNPGEHGQSRRGDPGLRHLVVGLEGRARQRLRRRRGGAPELLPRADEARRECLPGGRRRGDRLPRRAAAAKSTGNVLNVDGGVTAAYPR